jgi:hypothetical protein
VKQALGMVDDGLKGSLDLVDPVGPGETPTARVHLCRHCFKVLEGKVKATYNGAPLCIDNDPSCYKLVSQFHHEMPCLGNPCPGAVGMEHDHSEDVS